MTSREYRYLRRKMFKVFEDLNTTIKLKKPGCPCCGAGLVVAFDEWEKDKWGWMPTKLILECAAAPDFNQVDDYEWDEFMKSHYLTPYIDWLPIENRLTEYFQKKIRFTTDKYQP